MAMMLNLKPQVFLKALNFAPPEVIEQLALSYEWKFFLYSVELTKVFLVDPPLPNETVVIKSSISLLKIYNGEATIQNPNVAKFRKLLLGATHYLPDAPKPQNLGDLLKEKLKSSYSGTNTGHISGGTPTSNKIKILYDLPEGAAEPSVLMTPATIKAAKQLPKVKLSDASAVGQPVLGTSGGSTYYCVALNEKVKVGARLNGTAVSIRVEGELNSALKSQLDSSGLPEAGGGHHSAHFAIDKVPVERVIGALLLGIGVDFTQKVNSKSDLMMVLS